jgi:peptidoglycan/LPS O-acetylase OafA/YrhL
VATSGHSFDRLIGELSSPIYLNHLFFVVAARVLGDNLYPQAWSGLVAGLSSIAAAALFWHFILRRYEEKRHRMFGLQPA